MRLTAAVASPWALGANPLGLTELDVASGMVLGNLPALEWPLVDQDPLDVLFDEARRVLRAFTCAALASGVNQVWLACEEVAIAPLSWPGYLREVSRERGLRFSAITLATLCQSLGSSFAAPLLAPSPVYGAALPLHAAWLASHHA